MTRLRLLWCSAGALVVGWCLPAEAVAQDWFIDWSVDQSFSSTDPYRSPRGFTAALGGVALVGPLGAQVSFARDSDGGAEVTQDCVGATGSCVPGTIRTSYGMKTVGVGISYDFINPTDVMLTLGFTGTRSWYTERVRYVDTGDDFRNDLFSGLGFSASATLRLRPVLSGIRPQFAVHYEHGAGGKPTLDSSPWGGRNAFGVSVGLGWVARRRQRRP